MSYIERELIDGEQVVYRSKLHWGIFIRPIFFLVAAPVLFGIGLDMQNAGTKNLLFVLGALVFLIAILTFISPFIQYMTSEFGITTRRIIMKIGFIRRKSLEVLLNKVESIQVDQSILGRILGFGSITVTGTGGTKDTFHDIVAPIKFRKKAEEQIASFENFKNR